MLGVRRLSHTLVQTHVQYDTGRFSNIANDCMTRAEQFQERMQFGHHSTPVPVTHAPTHSKHACCSPRFAASYSREWLTAKFSRWVSTVRKEAFSLVSGSLPAGSPQPSVTHVRSSFHMSSARPWSKVLL